MKTVSMTRIRRILSFGFPWLLFQVVSTVTPACGFSNVVVSSPQRISPSTGTTRLYDTTFALFNVIQSAPPLPPPPPEAATLIANPIPQPLPTESVQQAATTLFVNMLTPASILAAGMISIGLKAPFQLPASIQDQPDKVARIEYLRRVYIVVTLISFCSELLAVMWATVAVNQLTERIIIPPGETVWDLIQLHFDLEWAAVNSHFVVGLCGFMYMVGIRGYIMLLAVEASEALIVSTASGVAAALLLMGSIVNRGVQAGAGDGIHQYGENVLDLFGHYVTLLYQRAVGLDVDHYDGSFGPLGLAAIAVEVVSITFAVYAILWPRMDRMDWRRPVLNKGDNPEEPNDNNANTNGSSSAMDLDAMASASVSPVNSTIIETSVVSKKMDG